MGKRYYEWNLRANKKSCQITLWFAEKIMEISETVREKAQETAEAMHCALKGIEIVEGIGYEKMREMVESGDFSAWLEIVKKGFGDQEEQEEKKEQ